MIDTPMLLVVHCTLLDDWRRTPIKQQKRTPPISREEWVDNNNNNRQGIANLDRVSF